MNKVECIKKAGAVVASILKKLKEEIKPNVSGKYLEQIASEMMKERKVHSSSLDYRGFPASICVSVNSELTHGIPNNRLFQTGDLVSVDVAVSYQGYHADAALTTIVGKEDNEEKRNLLKVTKDCLHYVIRQIKPNITTTQDIGAKIEQYIRARGYYPIKEYGGHGIGENLHQNPFIPNYKTYDKGTIIRTGMFICIEPLVQMSDAQVETLSDGWTVVSKNKCLNAHFEHTIYITEIGAEIITDYENK